MFVPERIEDRINKIVAEKYQLPIGLVDKVQTFQWKSVLEATADCKNIEITGLARMKTKPKVVQSNIEINESKIKVAKDKLTMTDDPKAISRITKRIDTYKERIEFLKSKL